jgi:hypothetical protein
MLKRTKYIVAILAVCFAASQALRPARTNPPIDERRTIQAQTGMPPEIAAIIGRACQDCHSYKTVWPWYSEIAPSSWLLISDVNEARKHLNLSDFARYNKGVQRDRLDMMCMEVKAGDMPLWYYKPLHPQARLTPGEIQTLCAWTTAEQTRLQ